MYILSTVLVNTGTQLPEGSSIVSWTTHYELKHVLVIVADGSKCSRTTSILGGPMAATYVHNVCAKDVCSTQIILQ